MNRLLLALALAGASSSPVWAQNQTKPAAPAVPKPPAAAAPADTTANGGIAADVNGEKISLDDLNRMVSTIKNSDPGLQTGSATATKALTDIKGQMLDELITTRLLAQQAKKQKISVTPKEVDDALGQLKGNFKTDDEFQKWLKTDNKSLADVRKAIGDELLIRALSKQLTADVTVSDDDIATYYRAHLEDFKVPQGVKARHIMLALNPNAPASDKAAVNKRAQGLIAQLKQKKTDFATLAKANSDDTTTKDNGGDLGSFPKGEMVGPIDDACFAPNVKAGDILGPITTDFGVHVIRVDEIIPEHQLTLDEVKNNPDIMPTLKAQLLKDKVQKRLDTKISEYRAAAKIQKYV